MSNFEIPKHNKKTITADNKRFDYRNDFGRKTEHILCPFCNQKTMAFTWSLSGCGKKCDFCKDTLHTAYSSAMRFKTEQAAADKLTALQEGEQNAG